MTFDTTRSRVIFATGKELYCHGAGLNYYPETEFPGWDSFNYGGDGSMSFRELTPAEILEAAEHMTAIWTALRDKYRAICAEQAGGQPA